MDILLFNVLNTFTFSGREGQTLDLMIFEEVLNTVAYVDRVLSTPRGSLLLAGRAGVGRKSAVRIIIQLAGVEGEQVYLLLEDHQVTDTAFLDMVNSLLSSGEVPGLYNTEELEPIVLPLKDTAAQEGFVGSATAYFFERVQKNLHVILVMDFTNSNFTLTCESNPALYKECCVMWLPGWSSQSMRTVPQLLLIRVEEAEGKPVSAKNKRRRSSVSDTLIEGFVKIHEQVSDKLATPQRYISFIHTYMHIYRKKKHEIQQRQQRLQAGVSKLTEARQVVDALKSQAAIQEQKLAEKQEKANAALQMITETMRNANTHKVEMESLKDPVGNIKSESLSEIRSMRAPPDIIRDILEGVLRLMGILDTSWNSMKTFLAKRGVKEEIRTFDARRINPDSRHAVEKLLVERKDSFDPKNARRASVAAAPLAAWVTANVKYSYVLEKIRPLEREQSKLHQNLKLAEEQIGKLSVGLTDVDKTVTELKNQLNTYTKEAAELEIHLNKAQETINAAEGLVGKLNDEYERWKSQLMELSQSLKQLPINSLLGSAFITYLSVAPEDLRRSLMAEWQEILGVDGFSLTSFLGSEKEQLQWLSEGLPSDQLSIQNALIILQETLCPFLVDPSSQATEWLKRHLQGSTIEVISQQSERFTTTLELAVRFGKVLIVQEVDSIEPVLFPILRGDFINQACALQQEKPELEQRRSELLRQEEELKLKLDQLQEILLHELANAQGDILQNKDLLASLNEAKVSSTAIYESLSESSHLQAELNQECDVYRPLAEFGSTLYFVVTDLGKLNNMYQFSVSSFMRLFQKALIGPKLKDNIINELKVRIDDLLQLNSDRDLSGNNHSHYKTNLCQHVEMNDHNSESGAEAYIRESIESNIPLNPRNKSASEWTVFTGQAVSDIKIETSRIGENLPNWIEEERAFDVFVLKNSLPELFSELQLDDKGSWTGFSRSGDCENNFPVQLTHKLTPFQRVLVVQALRPDRLHSALVQFSLLSLGLQDLSPPALSLKQLLTETIATEPILLVISPGADPSEELRSLAQLTVGEQHYFEVAMGQGQVTIALEHLHTAARQGSWLCLKNLHLMTYWLPTLEKELKSLEAHENFRLWLTAEAHLKFSAILAQSCLKVTYESPQGVKKNLQRTYASWGPEFINKEAQGENRSRALFVLAWFHAVVQERRTFIPQGWAKFYEFSDADLRAGAEVLQQLFKKGNSFF
ncbi:Cytoplasmic dynein 2 heavy chain 1 [Blattella germanica]|nr:Cytoplasmic dynein 2 heavy chain 1 [Blattella germanica]